MEQMYLKSKINIFLFLLLVSCSIEPLTESQYIGMEYKEVYRNTGTFLDIEEDRMLFGYISDTVSYLNILNLSNKETEFMDTFRYYVNKAFIHDSFLIILTQNSLWLYSIPHRNFLDLMFTNNIFKMDSIFIFNKNFNVYALKIKETRFDTVSLFVVGDSFEIKDVYKNYVLISTANHLLVLKYDGTFNIFSTKTKEADCSLSTLNDNYIINYYPLPSTLEFLSIKGTEKWKYEFFTTSSIRGYKGNVFIIFKVYAFFSIGMFEIKKGRLIEHPVEVNVSLTDSDKVKKITDNYLILQSGSDFRIYTPK